MNNNKSIEKTDDNLEPATKLEWSAPKLETLDFGSTEGGAGAFGEGTVGGFPVGSQAS